VYVVEDKNEEVDVYMVDVYSKKDETGVEDKRSVEVEMYAHYNDYRDLVRKNCFE
jgi:hypothetical protein